jgi:hypothetical protein
LHLATLHAVQRRLPQLLAFGLEQDDCFVISRSARSAGVAQRGGEIGAELVERAGLQQLRREARCIAFGKLVGQPLLFVGRDDGRVGRALRQRPWWRGRLGRRSHGNEPTVTASTAPSNRQCQGAHGKALFQLSCHRPVLHMDLFLFVEKMKKTLCWT